MTHRATCPECSTSFTLSRDQLGQSIRCSRCRGLFKISALETKHTSKPARHTEGVSLGVFLFAVANLSFSGYKQVFFLMGMRRSPADAK